MMVSTVLKQTTLPFLKLGIAVGVAACSLSVMAEKAPAAIVFDNADAPLPGASFRSPSNSPIANIQVSDGITLTGISVNNDLNSAGNIKFLIFDGARNLVFSTQKAFTDDGSGFSWKDSNPFSFALTPGQWFIGGIADVGGRWAIDLISNTQNGITSVVANGNVNNFDSPAMQSVLAEADIQIRLSSNPVQPIPTPALLPGLIGLGVAAIRKRKAGVADQANDA